EVPGSNITIEDPRVTSRTPVDGEVRLNVAVSVVNTGDAEGTIAVDFSLDGQVKSMLVTVPANSFVDASTFFLAGPGSYELCAEIIGTRNCVPVSVAPPGDQGIITAIDVPFLATPGDVVDASVSMMSVADVSRRFRITLTRTDTGGTVIDETVTVASFQEASVQGGFTMPNNDVGLEAVLFYELDGDFIEDEVLGDAVGVRPPASANLSIAEPEVTSVTPIDGDVRVNVAVPVTNTGDASATAAVDLSFDGEMKTKRIEVPAGGTTNASTFFIAAPGSYEVCGVLGEERKCSPVEVAVDGDGVGCPADKIDVAGACFTVGDMVLTGGSLILGTVAITRLLR
ncbi:MAG: hypothetical protein GWN55_06065, partial [Phycisphaerae bacterium]|nr:hypothetical protein [candidate division KSB1 bacterium]NIU25297.1 hypothetical protein [candidate division KSB1 bacterium]NIV00881.1 hypothetical protein [Phycisphaerae bacterium]NIW19145.1 hypothetical protein [candidate division KSB1 bacterium]NIW69723.1 hypothetical protein [candidate division KSB1 bacterium]